MSMIFASFIQWLYGRKVFTMSKRKWLDSEKKNLIKNLIFGLLRDIQFNKINLFDSSESDLKKLVAKTVFVSKSTVDKVLRENTLSGTDVMDATNDQNEAPSQSNNQPDESRDANESTPQIHKRKGRPTKSFTTEQENVLRQIIYDFHKTENCHVTLKRLLTKVKSELNFDGGLETLRKIIKRMGFRWRKTKNNRQILMEREDIRLWR